MVVIKAPDIPSFVMIGAHRVRVDLIRMESKGEFAHEEELIITLNDKVNNVLLAETFLHEIMHGLWYLYKVGGDPNQVDAEEMMEMTEEEVVSRMAFALTTFIVKNPEAWRWYESLLE